MQSRYHSMHYGAKIVLMTDGTKGTTRTCIPANEPYPRVIIAKRQTFLKLVTK